MTMNIDTLEKELAKMATTVKTSLFPQGHHHGHIACIISDDAYRAIVRDENFKYEDPIEPAACNLAIIATTEILQHKQMEVEVQWDKTKQDYQHYMEVQYTRCSKIEESVGHQYLQVLNRIKHKTSQKTFAA